MEWRDHTVLVIEATIEPDAESDFLAWIALDHTPQMVPQIAVSRYRAGEGRVHLLIHEAEASDQLPWGSVSALQAAPGVLATVAYRGKPIAHYGAPINQIEAAPVLYCVAFPVPDQHLSDFDQWYDGDHAPHVMQDPGWLGIRRFHVEASIPAGFTRLALHYLASANVLDGASRRKARQTEWRQRMAAEPWFKGRYTCAFKM